MDYNLLPLNWVIDGTFDMVGQAETCRYTVALRNTKTTEVVLAHGATENEAYFQALQVAKEMRTL